MLEAFYAVIKMFIATGVIIFMIFSPAIAIIIATLISEVRFSSKKPIFLFIIPTATIIFAAILTVFVFLLS